MTGLWLPAPPPGYLFKPTPDAPPDEARRLPHPVPKGKLGFDPGRIVLPDGRPAKAATR